MTLEPKTGPCIQLYYEQEFWLLSIFATLIRFRMESLFSMLCRLSLKGVGTFPVGGVCADELGFNPLFDLLWIIFVLQRAWTFIGDCFRCVILMSRVKPETKSFLVILFHSLGEWWLPFSFSGSFNRFMHMMPIHTPCRQTWAAKLGWMLMIAD